MLWRLMQLSVLAFPIDVTPNHRLTIGLSRSQNLRYAISLQNDVLLHTLTCQGKGGIHLHTSPISEVHVGYNR
jgi:hypothetical protein